MEDLSGIKDIVGASEEIASMKMRSIRNKVLLSRDLNDELTEIYREVTTSYKNQILLLMQEKKGKQQTKEGDGAISLKSGNGKLAAVYLSANSGLFSKILERTFYEFIKYLDKHPEAEPIVIGEFGKQLFTNNYPTKKFIFYPLAEGRSSEDSLKKITEELADYSSVIIYYARFESMAHQTTTVLDVSGQESGSNSEMQAAHYLFEPSLEKIIAFFESEIFSGIIQQTVTESELARYASRITTLDMARENIHQQLKITNLQRRFAVHRIMNKKQTEAITGMSLWRIR